MVQEVEARVKDMNAIDEAILSPQRTGDEEQQAATIARKTAAMLFPLIKREPFADCNDRITHAVAQRFIDRNGFVLKSSYRDILSAFEGIRAGDVSLDTFADWLEPQLATRFDSSHRERIFACLNLMAEIKAALEERPGLHRQVDQLDTVGYTLAEQAGTLFRLEEEHNDLRDRFPVFWEAWSEALHLK